MGTWHVSVWGTQMLQQPKDSGLGLDSGVLTNLGVQWWVAGAWDAWVTWHVSPWSEARSCGTCRRVRQVSVRGANWVGRRRADLQ